ncbi:glucose-6-phosphate dehydrogenase [Schleiferilactobacillus perolens]|nr:glucose-6-phosphate dehydrogenase [Schleiferilactobacillus perolens]
MMTEERALFIIFGGSGDLAQRKLYPALYGLYFQGRLAKHFAVIGTARRPWTDDHYHEVVKQSLVGAPGSAHQKTEFAEHFYYQSHDVTDAAHYVTLQKLASKLNLQYQLDGNRIFYMAMAPRFFATIAEHVKSEQLLSPDGYNRLIVEKPFGRDYASAKQLNDDISQAFSEEQIYRIDHYLGKEMVQDIMPLRFTNPFLENVWSNQFIDNIQITLAEDIGVEERAGYYETAGALRDMVQNHIFQIIAMLTMEKPSRYDATAIHEAKRAVLAAIKPYTPAQVHTNFVRGQYVGGDNLGLSYREEDNIAADSTVETYVAGRVDIDNDRWRGVPIYLRTGKKMPAKTSRIDIVFKPTKDNILPTTGNAPVRANVVTLIIEPDTGMHITLNGKEIGVSDAVSPFTLDHALDKDELAKAPEAYQRLLLNILEGNKLTFTHWDELAASWHFIDAVRNVWDNDKADGLAFYPSETMGPKQADELLSRDYRTWIWQGK